MKFPLQMLVLELVGIHLGFGKLMACVLFTLCNFVLGIYVVPHIAGSPRQRGLFVEVSIVDHLAAQTVVELPLVVWKLLIAIAAPH